ncbi:HD domain-containing protein [Candidatus Peregrinibacteria bacterium]|jgi:dGTP triphosphohydrolase|nr:HD domain-containing protein [Candidatus Peregrinibacteria bacterium]MBT4148023.1 HD domain-containing protein [Candidatus Peregrinibacteria bacterium]MBT4455598.1 HD domain-containing protein [Candidatus Peregrinibacteria bacterium]
MELDPDRIVTDELGAGEVKEICEEITARNLGKTVAPSKFATLNEDAVRQHSDKKRSGAYEYAQNPYQEDSRRGSFSNAYERLARKTQVCTNPTRDHITSRLIHADRVAQISRAIARAIGANEDLTEAIARLHDIGHAPLGHLGEELVTRAVFDSNKELMGTLGVFRHNIQGVHVVDRVATRKGFLEGGLNLTDQVRHGILSHDGEVYTGAISPNRDLKPEDLDGDIQRYMKEVIAVSGKPKESDPEAIKKHIEAMQVVVGSEFDIEGLDDDVQDYIKKVIKISGQVKVECDLADPEAVNEHVKAIEKAVKGVTIAPATIEACIVFIVDVLHYAPEDFEDIIALGEAKREHLPLYVSKRLGTNVADMMHAMITDLVVHSYGKDQVGYSEEVGNILNRFKKEFLYPRYYRINSWAYSDARDPRIDIPPTPKGGLRERMVFLFDRYLEALKDPGRHSKSSIVRGYLAGRDMKSYLGQMWHCETEEARLYQTVIDYVSGFTDNFFFSESEDMHR